MTATLLTALLTLAAAGNAAEDIDRGALLYETHCAGCHTTQVHWREKSRIDSITALRAMVSRWHTHLSLGWSERDTEMVVRYLNRRYYRFAP